MAEQNEGLNRIVYSGVLVAIQREIDFLNENEDRTVDVTVAAIRMIIDGYDKYFHTGRVPNG